jgi:membrane protein YdbS with pleckstrin-like domain
MVRKSDILSFTYDGNDDMLGKYFSHDSPLPKCHPDFKVQLKLQTGNIVDASPVWRRKIWRWWVESRRLEVMNNVLVQVSNDMLGRNKL